jgi:hypothetical protein
MGDTPRLRDGHRLLREAGFLLLHISRLSLSLSILKKCPPITFMLCLRYSQFLFEIARGNGHETEFANGVEGAVRVVAVRENRYAAVHLVSSLYAQDRNYGTSPQPKASARIQIVTDTEMLEKRGFRQLRLAAGGRSGDSDALPSRVGQRGANARSANDRTIGKRPILKQVRIP